MAHSASDDLASMGLSEPCSPKRKPMNPAVDFDFHDAAPGGYGFTTPLKKGKPSNGYDLFDSSDVYTPGKKPVTHAFDWQCSTASTSAPDASPWPSPFSSSTPSIEYDVTSSFPSLSDAAQLTLKMPCFKDDFENFNDTLQPTSCSKTLRTDFSQFPDFDMFTPPATPRNARHVGCSLKLPSAPTRKPSPPLLTALQLNSVEMVRDVIADDADASKHPFWDHNNEPPLCCAARLCCDAPIISHLLQYGADVNATNAEGNTALDIVRRPLVHRRGDDVGLSDPIFAFTSAFPPAHNKEEVERLLLAKGACTSATLFIHDGSAAMHGSYFDTEIHLLGDQDIGHQFDASSVWPPTMPPWNLDVPSMKAAFEAWSS